jgi:starvation-inducible DNA-binding protein
MEERLIEALKVVQADHYSLYFKAHGFHWNVEGKNFPQYHEFYSEIYEDVYEAIDTIAEDIRKLGAYAPFKMSRFLELTTIEETEVGPMCEDMNADLFVAVGKAIATVNTAAGIAIATNEQGIANDLAERDSMLKKWLWQLRSSMKG